MTHPSLTWGPLDFTGYETDTTPYSIEAMADGSNFGNPDPIIEVVKSLLNDGSLAVLEGWNNRTVQIRLRVSAPRGLAGPALAQAESALMAQVIAPAKSPLVYEPAVIDGDTCVFDVVAAELSRDTSDGWDFEESFRECRYYLLTLTCLPFARSGDVAMVEALPVPPSEGGTPAPPETVLIDDLNSPSNWTGYANSGYIASNDTGYSKIAFANFTGVPFNWVALSRSGAVTMGDTPYLIVDVKSFVTYDGGGWGGPPTPGPQVPPSGTLFRIYIDGVGYGAVATDIGGGEFDSTRLTIAAPPSFSTLVLDYYVDNKGTASGLAIEVLKVQRASIPGDTTTSTTRQQSRAAIIDGSAPTTGAIRLYDNEVGATLGSDVLVYTGSSDFRPALRRWLYSSATVDADDTTISGGKHTLGSPTEYLIRASIVATGNYALMANMSVATAGTLTYTASLSDDEGNDILGSSVTSSGSIALSTTSGFKVLQLGNLSLPPVATESPDAFVKITLTGTSNMTIDEAWIFNLDSGVLTWVREPLIQWLEIRSPELGAARPSIYGGIGVEPGVGGACIDYAAESFGTHRFDPGTIQIFTVTSNSQLSQSDVRYYPRFHSHVEALA